MTDIVDRETRSRMMASIRAKNTKPELIVRRYLHSAGFRFRLHRRDLPGTPDIVMPRRHLVIFVHGCFWHKHEGCYYATSPASHKKFWAQKLEGNQQRDHKHAQLLIQRGWRVIMLWECGLKHQPDRLDEIISLIKNDMQVAEWPASPPRKRAD